MKRLVVKLGAWIVGLGLAVVLLWRLIAKLSGNPVINSWVQGTMESPKEAAAREERNLQEIKAEQRKRARDITARIEQAKTEDIKKRFKEAFGR